MIWFWCGLAAVNFYWACLHAYDGYPWRALGGGFTAGLCLVVAVIERYKTK